MASRTAVLSVKILTDASQGQRGMDEMATGVERAEQRIGRLTGPATVAMGAIGLMGKSATDAASELQQSTGGVASVFKGYADEINNYARNASSNVGLATSEYQQMATIIGSQLKNMGAPMEDVAGQTNDLVGLGADLAATFGGTTSEAVSALSSLLRGERDPIERYGVSINQAAIDAQKAAMGLDGLTGEQARNADMQATMALLTKQTADATGQFAREVDTAAGSQQIANAEWQNAQAQLGEALLPAVTAVTTALGAMAVWVGENSDLVLTLTGVIAGLAAGVLAANAALKVYRATKIAVIAVTKGWTVAQRALNLVLRLNPIGLVITAIAALVAGVIIAYQRSETFRNVVQGLWAKLQQGAAIAAAVFRVIIGWIADAYNWVSGKLVGAWERGLNNFNRFKNGIVAGFRIVVDWISRAIGTVRSLFSFSMPGWMRNIGSIVGGIFSAPAEPQTMSAMTSRLTTQDAAATQQLVAPSVFAPSSAGTMAARATEAPVTINVNGALDPDATARQIERLLTRRGRRVGALTMGQRALAW